MVVEDQADRGVRRIGGVDQLEKVDELAAAVAVGDQGMNFAGESIPASKLTVPWRLYSNSRVKVGCTPGSGGKSGAVVAIA